MDLYLMKFYYIVILGHVWFFQESRGCDERIWIESGRSLEIVSPDYPENTPRRMHCFYDVTTRHNSGDIIHMTVLETELSCSDENITLLVFDAFSASAQYLGRICQGGNRTFVSPKDRLYLVYQTGRFPGSAFTPPPPLHLAHTVTSAGSTTEGVTSGSQTGGSGGRAFRLHVKGVPEFSQCYGYNAKVLPARQEPGQLVTPYFPLDVAPNVHCRWLIKAPEGQRVELHIVNASMRGSNDCQNFGLYLYDGKTTYDDTTMAVICDNQSDSQISQRYFSSGNFLLVVFSSSSHVLHSGGGVKISYNSVLWDTRQGGQDKRLLYSLMGCFFFISFLTASLALLRYVIIPVRQKKSARRLDILGMSRESGISDLPPPYTPSPSTSDIPRVENTYTATFSSPPPFSELSYRHDIQAPVTDNPPSFSELSYRHDIQATVTDNPPSFSELSYRHDIQATVTDNYRDGETSFSSNLHEIPSSVTATQTATPAVENDYQELPSLGLCRTNDIEPRVEGNTVENEDVSNSLGGGNDSVNFVDSGNAGDNAKRERDMGEVGFEQGQTSTAVAVGFSQDRTFLRRDSEDIQEDPSLTRNRLLVPIYHQARFSYDSGFTEAGDSYCSLEENSVVREETDPHYHQLSEFSPCGFSEDVQDIYANTSSMADAVFKSLELGRNAGQDTFLTDSVETARGGDHIMSLVNYVGLAVGQPVAGEDRAKNSSRQHEEQCKQLSRARDDSKDGRENKDDAADDDRRCGNNEDDAVHSQGERKQTHQPPLSRVYSNNPAKQIKQKKPTHSTTPEISGHKDTELEETRYEIPSDLLQSRLAVHKDRTFETDQKQNVSDSTSLVSEAKTCNPHYMNPSELREYDHLVIDSIRSDEVEYQVLNIGDV